MPKDTRVSLVEKPGEKSYGIVGFAWILANTKYDDADKKKVIVDLIKWANTEGQNYSNDLHYGKLPEAIIKLNEENIANIKVIIKYKHKPEVVKNLLKKFCHFGFV